MSRSTLPEELTIPTGRPALESYVHRLSSEHGASIEFLVFLGAPLRDEEASEVLVGIREEDDRRIIDPICEIDDVTSGRIDVYVHTPSEIRRMEAESDPLLLEALDTGAPMFDRGGWAALRETFARRVQEGKIRRVGLYWEVLDEPA